MKALLCWLFLLGVAQAAPGWKVDLNGDGKPETIRLVPKDETQGSWLVEVAGLWKSPDGLSDAGEWLADVGDADGDGRVDLVVGCTNRGGPPSMFAIFPWLGQGFEWRKQEFKPLFESGKDLYVRSNLNSRGRYLRIEKVLAPGRILAELGQINAGGEFLIVSGQAELRYTPQGYRVERWRIPFHRVARMDERWETLILDNLRDQDLAKLSAKELTMFRNGIFASHGRPFQDPQLRAYFAKKSWYVPNPAYTDAFLRPHDLLHAKKIADYQRRSGKNW